MVKITPVHRNQLSKHHAADKDVTILWNTKHNTMCTVTHWNTFLLTRSMERSPSWDVNRFAVSQEISWSFGTRRFITAFTCARHLSLSWSSSVQSIPPHPTSWSSILVLSSHLRLGLPSGLFLSGFPTKALYTSLLSSIRTTCPAHLILLDLIARTIFCEEHRSLSSSLCSFLYSLFTSSLTVPNILLNGLFSNNLSLR